MSLLATLCDMFTLTLWLQIEYLCTQILVTN